MSTYHKTYYWANLIVNPILLLVALVDQENSIYLLAVWVALSAILNPKIWGLAVSLGAGLGIGSVLLACWLASLGGVVTIVVGAILVGLLVGIGGVVLVLGLDVVLWVIAFVALKNDRRSITTLP